jgi:hypothetical protein
LALQRKYAKDTGAGNEACHYRMTTREYARPLISLLENGPGEDFTYTLV